MSLLTRNFLTENVDVSVSDALKWGSLWKEEFSDPLHPLDLIDLSSRLAISLEKYERQG